MLKQVIGSMIALGVAWAAPAAQAQERPVTLSSDVKLERLVESADGAQVTLAAPEGVVPGDTLVFTTSYRNAGGETVTDFVIVNPVPANLTLSREVPTGAEVSVDGGTSWGSLPSLSVTDEAGQERAAALADVTHLRWNIARLAPAQDGQVGFRAVVR